MQNKYNYIDWLVWFFVTISLVLNIATIHQLVKLDEKVKLENTHMIEQVQKLDENLVAIEAILVDQHTINDELANRLGNYSDNVQAVNELLAKLKGE